MKLPNSKRVLYSASHLSSKFTPDEQRSFNNKAGGALRKLNFLRALSLNEESHAILRDHISNAPSELKQNFAKIFEASTILSQSSAAHLDIAQSLAAVPDSSVLAFAKAVTSTSLAKTDLSFLSDLFEMQLHVSPIGRLYLERIEMFPIGVERGEMVFTVPMAPGESTTISHREWSVSTRGYEDVVQDFFESYSERGVTEKNDASTASETEVKRSNTLNFGATLSGSYGPVSLTTSLGLTNASEDRSAIKTSMQKNREVTEKSSARVRQEHKVSVKIESKQGLDTTSFKTIINTSPDAVRLDYYKMMRKWRTDLYRYGLRMTYDIAVPTPGVRLWARWRRLKELERLLATPLQFGWTPAQINEGWVFAEALKYGITVDGPPPFQIAPAPVQDTTPFFGHDDASTTRFGTLAFDVPPGYHLANATFDADMAVWADLPQALDVLNVGDETRVGDHISSALPEYINSTGHIVVSYAYAGISQASLRIAFVCVRDTPTFEAWQKSVWHQLRDAADARHREELGRLQEEHDVLWRALVGKDTLSLRRLEREEMVRLIMLWLLGPDAKYANAPSDVEKTVDQLLANEVAFLGGGPPAVPSPTFEGINGAAWARAVLFGDMVKFVQQAVEWENLLYFLYPYFWGGESQGRDKMLFEHPDPEHQNFLRAGYCRFVITIRPGFEEDFTRLVETGSLGGTYTSPYLPIAQEIANKARTNYAGIPPANPEKHARPQLYPQQRSTWATMELVIAAIEKFNSDNGHYPASLADLPAGVVTNDAWGNALVYSMPGSGNDYDLISLGSDGAEGGDDTKADISSGAGASLMATWFDYTPTSGVDIVVNTGAAIIA